MTKKLLIFGFSLIIIIGIIIIVWQIFYVINPGSSKFQEGGLIDNWRACNSDSDCIETQVDCCPCSSGGKQTAINKNYLGKWQNLINENCKNIACITLYACQEGKVVCQSNKCEFAPLNKNFSKVCFKNYCFDVELAKTGEEIARGLMFRKNLEQDKGMLFIFQEEGEYSFWMKNTLIPLDVVWFNQDKEVVFIKKNFEPCTQEICPGAKPNKKAKYVLELNAGIIEEMDLKVGDKMIFDID